MTQSLESRIKSILSLTSDGRKQRKGSKYSYIDAEIVIALLKSGLRLPEIAEIYNCSPATVSYQVRLEYLEFDARKYVRWGKWQITPKEVAKLYGRMKNCNKIAEMYGVNTHAITERLEKLGIKRRPLCREDISTDEVVKLYRKYGRTVKVAEILNTSPQLIRNRLEEAGITDFKERKYLYGRKRKDIPEDKVLELYDSGDSVASIGRKYNVNDGTIRRILVDNGREIRVHLPSYREDLTPERVAYWYKRLKRISRVAEKLGTVPGVVRDRLEDAGVSVDVSFRNERKRTDIPVRRVVSLHESGMSISEIARKYKTKRETIRRILDRAS